MQTTTLSAEQLLGARAATEHVLDHLGLTNYRFDVEPRESAFEVFIEHERHGAWHDVRLTEDAVSLLAVRRDASVRADVARRWRARLIGDG
jgi:hypothetical protein